MIANLKSVSNARAYQRQNILSETPTYTKAERTSVHEKHEKRSNNLRLRNDHIFDTSDNRRRTAITPEHDIEVAVEATVYCSSASNALESCIAIAVLCLSEQYAEAVGVDEVYLQTASGAIGGKARGVVEQQAHGEVVSLAGLDARGLLQQGSLGV